jgi:hypothetical protein
LQQAETAEADMDAKLELLSPWNGPEIKLFSIAVWGKQLGDHVSEEGSHLFNSVHMPLLILLLFDLGT